MTVIRVQGISVRLDVRSAVLAGVLLALTLAVAAYSLTTGDFPVPLKDVLASLTGRGDTGTDFIVLTLRLPRVLAALLVGAALGLSGAVFQNLTRNVLGSPDFIGLTVGAATGALIVILLLHGGPFATSAGALAGCALVAALIYGLARGSNPQGFKIILVGIGVSAMLDAFNTFLLTRSRLDEAIGAQRWLIGTLNGRDWSEVVPLAVVLAVLLPLTLTLSRRLGLFALGEETAAALGVPVERTRLALYASSVALAGVATAVAGPIGFVALAAPQLAKRLTRTTGPALGAAAVMGAFLLAISDLVAQRALPQGQVPVGIATSALGGVYLCWLLVHEWRRRA